MYTQNSELGINKGYKETEFQIGAFLGLFLGLFETAWTMPNNPRLIKFCEYSQNL